MHLTLRPLSRDEVRQVDVRAVNEFGMSSLVLMENAGRGAAERIDVEAPRGTVCIFCGTGNNGGDGFVIARHLQLLGRDVRVALIGSPDRLSEDAAANYAILIRSKWFVDPQPAPTEAWLDRFTSQAAVMVDALLGTGASGDPRGNMATVIRYMNQLSAYRIAIDLPTGLDCDSGTVGNPCFHAHLTCTFVSTKRGFLSEAAKAVIGKVGVIGIGVPRILLSDLT